MTSLNALKKTVRTAVRVGRGGKRGKTSGRGTKGQKARAGHRIRPEMRDYIKKLPKRRGHGKNRARTVWELRPRPQRVTLTAISGAFSSGETVDPKTLVDRGLVKRINNRIPHIKILAGTIDKKVSISRCFISQSAKTSVEKAGGSIA